MATLNLLCHIWPAKNELLRLNFHRLVTYRHVFNGRILFNIAIDEDRRRATRLREKLWRRFGGPQTVIEFSENEPTREARPFFEFLLPAVKSARSDEFTFFCHSKGVTTPDNPAVRRWVEWMYDHNLGDPGTVAEFLRSHTCAGCFRLQFPPPEEQAPWHYSGTFFWFNHERVFGSDEWRPTRYGRWSVEAWLGNFVPLAESLCLFGDGHGAFYDTAFVDHFLFGPSIPPPPRLPRVRHRVRFAERRLAPVDARAEFQNLAQPISPELRHILLAGSDKLSVFGGFYEGGHRVQQVPLELAEFAKFAKQTCPRGANYLEVGAASGGTARVLDDLCDFGRVFVVDDNRHLRAPERVNTLPHAVEFVGDSHGDACRMQLKQWRTSFDCILIDADHSYSGVRQDTDLVLPHLARGGVIAYHDVRNPETPGVQRWVDELRNGAISQLKYQGTFGDRLGIAVFRDPRSPRPRRRIRTEEPRANLLFHLAPIPSPMLDYHIHELGKQIPKFNNKVVVSISQDAHMLDPDAVKTRVCRSVLRNGGDPGVVEFVPVDNRLQSEADAFFDCLLPRVASDSDNEFTFFGHTKGVSRGRNLSVRLWVEWNNHFLLGNLKAIHALLRNHACAGAFRLRNGCDVNDRGKEIPVKWFYAGAFFWLNNARVFNDERWKVRGHGRWSVESWLGRFIPFDEACCVFGENAAPLYWERDFHFYGGPQVARQYEEFLLPRRRDANRPPLAVVPAG